MELNITALKDVKAWNYSRSVAETGEDTGADTWNAAKRDAPDVLDTPEKLRAFRDYARGFGAWDREEVEAWSANECNALLLQMIAGDVREAGADTLAGIAWDEYQQAAEAGRVAGKFFLGAGGEYYYSLSE